MLEELLYAVKPLRQVIANIRGKVEFDNFKVEGLTTSVCAFGAILATQARLARVRGLVATEAFTVESNWVCEPLEGILNHTKFVGYSNFQPTKVVLQGDKTRFHILNVFFVGGHFDLALTPIDIS